MCQLQLGPLYKRVFVLHMYKYNPKSTQLSLTWIWLFNCIVSLQWLCWLLQPIKQMNLPLTTNILIYLANENTFNRGRAEKYLKYKPLYTHEECVTKSMQYYVNLWKCPSIDTHPKSCISQLFPQNDVISWCDVMRHVPQKHVL